MVSKDLIKKWMRMLSHNSVLHVNQGEGKYYSVSGLAGYYNDLREKVERTKNFDKSGIPTNVVSYEDKKRTIYFPIAIFQYGLGAYDLWLETKDEKYRTLFLKMADWAIENQKASGAWDTFGALHYANPYSAMAQGEGASLLARAYKTTNDNTYKTGCEKAIHFMLTPLESGGTTDYSNNGMVLKEYPDKPTVLNGWMFAGFGLWDCWLITQDEHMKAAWTKTVKEIEAALPDFDSGFWSCYDDKGKYTSPFYHSLHIELLKAYCQLTGSTVMKQYEEKWSGYKNSWVRARLAFGIKAFQKVSEKKKNEWVMVE